MAARSSGTDCGWRDGDRATRSPLARAGVVRYRNEKSEFSSEIPDRYFDQQVRGAALSSRMNRLPDTGPGFLLLAGRAQRSGWQEGRGLLRSSDVSDTSVPTRGCRN